MDKPNGGKEICDGVLWLKFRQCFKQRKDESFVALELNEITKGNANKVVWRVSSDGIKNVIKVIVNCRN